MSLDFNQFKIMLKRVFLGLFVAVTIACTAAPRVENIDVPGSNNLKPEPRQSEVTKQIAELVTNLSYKRVKLNDSLGSVIFDNYLKSLDGNKSYFLASDVNDFEKYRLTFDDDMESGDLTAAFYMFNVYQKRYNERINYSIETLNNKFDFDKKEEEYIINKLL